MYISEVAVGDPDDRNLLFIKVASYCVIYHTELFVQQNYNESRVVN